MHPGHAHGCINSYQARFYHSSHELKHAQRSLFPFFCADSCSRSSRGEACARAERRSLSLNLVQAARAAHGGQLCSGWPCPQPPPKLPTDLLLQLLAAVSASTATLDRDRARGRAVAPERASRVRHPPPPPHEASRAACALIRPPPRPPCLGALSCHLHRKTEARRRVRGFGRMGVRRGMLTHL